MTVYYIKKCFNMMIDYREYADSKEDLNFWVVDNADNFEVVKKYNENEYDIMIEDFKKICEECNTYINFGIDGKPMHIFFDAVYIEKEEDEDNISFENIFVRSIEEYKERVVSKSCFDLVSAIEQFEDVMHEIGNCALSEKEKEVFEFLARHEYDILKAKNIAKDVNDSFVIMEMRKKLDKR